MRSCAVGAFFSGALWYAALATSVQPSIAATPLVYECRQGDIRVLTDRPCGADSSLRAVDLQGLNRYTPVRPPAPTDPQRKPRGADRRREAGKPRAPKARGCWEIQNEIDHIDSRMRLGYTGKIGEKLRAQRRELKDQYASQRCNTTSRQPPS